MSQIIYKGFRKEELEYQYNPQVSVPDYPQLAEVRRKKSQVAREALQSWLNVPYGNSPRQVLDIFPADQPLAPVLLFIHGGYWRGGSKDDNCGFAPLFVHKGATVVLLEHDLCPTVTVTDIVGQTRSAIAWTYHNINRYKGNPAKLFITGHSAGGHLAAMALAHVWEKEGLPRDIIKGAAVMSGVLDLDMVMNVNVNEDIRMTPEIAHDNSPLLHPPLSPCPILVAVGGAEPEGWKQMSKDYFQFCQEHGVEGEYLEIPGANHYTMANHLADAKSLLNQAIMKLMNL
jgi:arylformamidase